MIKSILSAILLTGSSIQAAEIFFKPRKNELCHKFKSNTQMGIIEQTFELRQLNFKTKDARLISPSVTVYYIIHHCGDEYGPYIIGQFEGVAPIMKAKGEIIEIYYIAGAHTHVKEIWSVPKDRETDKDIKRLSREGISWKERPKK